MAYKNGSDLILGLMINKRFFPLGHSTTCKISDSSETGERVTKETSQGKFKEKYVKSLSEQITAEGFHYGGDDAAERVGLPTLKTLWLSGKPVTAVYRDRNVLGELNKGEGYQYFKGEYVITSLEEDAPAGDDVKYSLTLENSGPVVGITAPLKDVAAESLPTGTDFTDLPDELQAEVVKQRAMSPYNYSAIGNFGDDDDESPEVPEVPEG